MLSNNIIKLSSSNTKKRDKHLSKGPKVKYQINGKCLQVEFKLRNENQRSNSLPKASHEALIPLQPKVNHDPCFFFLQD